MRVLDGKRLVLFDIDGTLVNCGPQVRPIFRRALEATWGLSCDLNGYDFAGKTDDQIVVDLLSAAGVAPHSVAAGLPRMRREYHARLEEGLEAARMALLPGVRELLGALAAGPDRTLALLTGNWEATARVKLSRFDLNGFFSFGAFGDGVTDRRELPPVALRRAARVLGRPVAAEETLIVGDTPLDVACAEAHGIDCLAVATGTASVAQLAAAGARLVCHNLAMLEGATDG